MSLPIVGIGASAGGLESFSELLAHIPADTGMPYVYVQHLDPEHASLLVEILSQRAGFPVEQAREGVKILPDRLYVIAPNTTLTIEGVVLHLRRRDPVEKPHRPVDAFFHSLAHERGPNAIGIILSGSGSDGAKGIQAVKQAGGITFAQDESSALFLWNAQQRHPNGLRRFCSQPWRHCAGVSKDQSPSLTLEGTGPDC
jgi:two-component system CheB/CheR fusion protein